jgi:hemerythrin
MNRFLWTDEYSVANNAVDADHQTFFALASELATAAPQPEQLADVLHRLEAYAQGHFAREEALMAAINYPALEEHVKSHRKFVDWLNAETARYRNAGTSHAEIAREICAFVEEWLVRHIMNEDMRYRDYIMTRN